MLNAILWKIPHIRFMKQEFTIAVVLLAIGILFWISGQRTNSAPLQAIDGSQLANSDVAQIDAQREQAANFASDQQLGHQSEYSVVPASYQQPVVDGTIVTEPANLSVPSSVPLPNGSGSGSNSQSLPAAPQFSATAGYLHATSNRQAVDLLENAATEIANSNPFRLKLSLRGRIFQQEIVASGDYYQKGQGSHKTKIELSFDHLPGRPQMLQLCDGRFVYTIHAAGGTQENNATPPQQKLEFVDLLRVKQATGDAANQGVVSPTGWVATGGVASLLQHLASGFNFGAPEALDPNSDRILIRGSWDENALRGIVSNLDNNVRLGSPIQWAKVPKHLPHLIEMVLVRGSNRAYFPNQISFFQVNAKDHQTTIEPNLLINFSPPEPLTNLAEGFFVIDSSNLNTTDATDKYIARIESFQRSQVATQLDSETGSLIK